MKDVTMKLSLITACVLASLASLAACGTSDDGTLPAPVPAASATATAPPAPPAKRTLASGTQLVASPLNLLLDPGFGLVGGQAGYGMFLAFLDADYTEVTLGATLDSRSPAGFGGAVALVKPDGATNKSSSPVLVLASFQGGDGPFAAKVWLSKSAVDGTPVDFGTDAKTIRASITDATPDGDAFDLAPVTDATRSIGGRTWVLFQAAVPKALPYGGYFVVHTGGGGGQWHIAAPEVVAQPLVDGSTKSLVFAAPGAPRSSAGRTKTLAERQAITKYRSLIKPRLLPAGSTSSSTSMRRLASPH